MRRVLLDTNAYTAYMAKDAKVRQAIAEADEVPMSVFVLGEVHAGFQGGTKLRRNLEFLREFLDDSRARVLEATAETAEVFGWIKASLTKAGTPIPIQDIWIAAQAIQTGSVLITYDRHFLQVAGLRTWDELG